MPNFNVFLTKPPLKLGHEWVIKYYKNTGCCYFSYLHLRYVWKGPNTLFTVGDDITYDFNGYGISFAWETPGQDMPLVVKKEQV